MAHVPDTHKVTDEEGICQHTGSLSSCQQYIANARSLFGGTYYLLSPR